jgi:hypothetical protein
LKQRDQDVLRKLLDQLTHAHLFVVESTTNCHEHHLNEILTKADLTNIRTAGITVTVDGNFQAQENEEESEEVVT